MRLFVASRLEESVATTIVRGMRALRARVPRASWVGEHAFHLTYAFLGEQDERVAEPLIECLRGALAASPRYEGALSGGGFFPNARRPRVGWLAFEDVANLMAIAEAVRRALDRERVEYDRKAFKPHLTVVRIRDRWGASDADHFLQACAAFGRIGTTIDRVSLFRSELAPTGARHHELGSVTLAGD